MGWKPKLGKSNFGALAGTALMPGIGTFIGYTMDQQAKAQQEMDDAAAAAGAATQAEINRRTTNVNEIRAQYGETHASQNAQQQLKAQRMGTTLAADTRAVGSSVLEAGTQANLANTGTALTQANTAAAATGNLGSSMHKQGKANVMGAHLLGRQNVAAAAAGARESAVEKLAAGQQAAEASAMGGGLNIDPVVTGHQQAGAFRAANAMVPVNTMGNLINMGANTGAQSLLNDASSGGGMGTNPLSGGRSPTGNFTQTR
jgi:hypothetical protein